MKDKKNEVNIIPSSILESKKQKKLSTKFEKWFGKNIKALSPINCLSRTFNWNDKNKVFKVCTDELEIDRPNLEIYVSEFSSIEMKYFGNIEEEKTKKNLMRNSKLSFEVSK